MFNLCEKQLSRPHCALCFVAPSDFADTLRAGCTQAPGPCKSKALRERVAAYSRWCRRRARLRESGANGTWRRKYGRTAFRAACRRLLELGLAHGTLELVRHAPTAVAARARPANTAYLIFERHWFRVSLTAKGAALAFDPATAPVRVLTIRAYMSLIGTRTLR